jgi:hypothetical protein
MVFLWGGSLAFQCVTNYVQKSTIGYSIDFCVVGTLGFALLMFNQTIGMINPHTDAGRVNMSDLSFAILALNCSTIAFVQSRIYPATPTLTSTRVMAYSVISLFFFAAIVECYYGMPLKSYAGVSLINLAAFFKAGSSLLKYLYQIYENMKNKSTEGVSKLAY